MNFFKYIRSVFGAKEPPVFKEYKPEVIEPKQEPIKMIVTQKEKRSFLYDTMVIKDKVVDNRGRVIIGNVYQAVEIKVNRMFANRSKYQAVSGVFRNPIKWYHIALIHDLECSQNFNCYLGNGQPFYSKTSIVPKNRGPFKSFVEGAIDAIKLQKLDLEQDWSVGNMLYIMEGFNGYGYSLYRGINSPYIWSGSNHYESGKYIADGVYSKGAVSNQIGVALLYKRILEKL